MPGRRIAGTGEFFVAYHDHDKPADRLVYRFQTPQEAKNAATRLNAWAGKNNPIDERCGAFSFYYVHTARNSGTLPWLAGTVKLLEVKHTEANCEY